MSLRTFRSPRQRGSTLIVAIFVVALLTTFIGLALDYTAGTARPAAHNADYTRAQAAANGALEAAFKSWQLYMNNNQGGDITKYATKTLLMSNVITPIQSNLQTVVAGTGFTLQPMSITPVDRADNSIAAPVSTGTGYSYSQGPMTNVPGWIATTYTFNCTVQVTNAAGDMTVSISRFFQQSQASLFQAMLFFQDDLELHPGAAMTLYGLVHTNSNLYAATGASLTFQSNVSYHGSQTTLKPAPNYKYEDPNGYVEGVTATLYAQEASSWQNFSAPVYSTARNSQLSNVQALDPLGMSADSAVVPGNANATGTHEIIERPVPVSAANPNANTAVSDPAAFSANRVYNSAGVRIFVNHNVPYTTPAGVTSKIHVYTSDPNNAENSIEVIPGLGTAGSPYNLANYAASSITPGLATGNIYDFREGRAISLDTVDMSVLSPNLPVSSTVYISDVTNADASGNTGNSDAIRLTKGATLNSAVTMVTDGAMYVQGDYNTGGTYNAAGVLTTQPVSNSTTSPDPTQYTVSGKTQVSAAVMGDAVMVLSNAWSDTNGFSSIGARVATPTTFNAALVSGMVVTTATAASGGAHNFPRFLENWGGDNFTYHGSMCELYSSTHFTGTYGKSNVYSPPNRRWYFDNNFLANPPPGNLRSTTLTRGRWVRNTNL